MASIRTTIIGGRVEFAAPAGIPNGTEVIVELAPVSDKLGLDESQWDDSPGGIAKWLKWYDSLEPLIFTAAELSEIEADRQARKQWNISQFDDHAEKLAKQWQ